MQRSNTQPFLLDLFNRLLTAPQFLNDDSKTRTAHALHMVLLANLLFVLLFGIWMLLTTEHDNMGGLLALMLTFLTPSIPLFFLRQGKVRLAGMLFIISTWLLTSAALLVSSGVNTMLGSLYIAAIAMALLFFGWRTSLLSIAITLVYTFILSAVDLSSIPKIFTITPFVSWILLCLSLVLVLIPIGSMYSALLTALTHSQEELSAREKAEQALRENEERFRLITTATSDYSFSTRFADDGQMTQQLIDGAFEKITGYAPDEFIANGGWKSISHPDDVTSYMESARVLYTNQPMIADTRIIRKDGAVRWVHVSAHPIWDAKAQKLVAISGGVQDITARKEAETALQENEERFRLISTVTSDYTFSSRFNTEGGLQHRVLSGAFEAITGYTPDAFITIGGWASILHPDDREIDQRSVDVLRQNKPSTGEVRIIRKDGQVRWVRVSAYPIWDAERQTLIGINGGVQDITERKQAENAIRESELLLRTVINHLPDTIYAKDLQGRYLINNRESLKRMGAATQEQVRGKTDFDFFPHELAAEWWAACEQIIASGKPALNQEVFFDLFEGTTWLSASFIPLHNAEGAVIGLVVINRDITERKLAENAIREQEALLRAVIDHIPDPIYVKDLDCRFLINNAASLHRIGVSSQEEIVGKTDFDYYPYDISAEWDQNYRRIMSSGMALLNEEVHLKLGEGGIWFSTSIIPFRNMDGNVIGLVSINRDITARKLAENALQESERRYRLTSELISDYAYAYTIAEDGTRTLTWITEQSFNRLTGFNSEEMRNKVEIYHPDDRDRVREDVAKTMRGEATDSEYRIVTVSGEIKWLHVVRQVEWDADHTRPIRYYGSAADITERKQAELALVASEQRYRITAELISDYAFAYDIMPDGSLELAWGTEQSYQRVTGYDWKTFPTQPDLYHPDDRARLLADRQRAIEGDPIIGEYRIVTATGAIKWVSVKRAVEWDETHTRPIHFYGAITDITERKYAEIALHESKARLRALLDATNDVAFLMSRDYRLLTLNKPLAERMNRSVEDLIGQNGLGLLPEEQSVRQIYFDQALQAKQPIRWMDSGDGEQWDNCVYPVLSSMGEVEAFAVFSRNITEEARLAAELQRYATQLEHMVEERTTELRRAKEQIEIILNNTRDAIALAQPNGDIQTRNPAFVAMFGEQVSRWIEGLLWTVSGEEHSDSVGQALVNMLHSRKGQRIETQIAVDETGDKDIDLMFIPVSLEAGADQPGILVSAHDITRLKEIERFKARFVADAVHDLATPIAGLSTRLYLLKRSPEKLDVHMKALENQVEHFRDLLADLRTLSQLDRKQMTLDLQTVNIRQSIMRVFDTYEPVALSKDQTLNLLLDPDLPDMQLDRRQIERVFLNLVSNAINYSPEGKPVRIRAAREGDELVFAVTDEGIGMSAEEQAHVFERFYRADRARQTRSGGTGLGLAIVKEIIELHGGTVTVQSESGKGSTFTVCLPIKTA